MAFVRFRFAVSAFTLFVTYLLYGFRRLSGCFFSDRARRLSALSSRMFGGRRWHCTNAGGF
jgi:hypothetical protein